MPVRAQLHGFILHNLQHHETSLSIYFFFKFHNPLQAAGEPTFAKLGRYIRDCLLQIRWAVQFLVLIQLLCITELEVLQPGTKRVPCGGEQLFCLCTSCVHPCTDISTGAGEAS